jgi:hypothetical protein
MAQRRHHEDKIESRNGFKYIRLPSGRLLGWLDAMREAERARTALSTAVSRCFKLLNEDREIAEWDLERIEWFIDNLDSYTGAIRKEIERRRGTQKVEERIALLRNVDGRTPDEAEEFLRKADELERRLREST